MFLVFFCTTVVTHHTDFNYFKILLDSDHSEHPRDPDIGVHSKSPLSKGDDKYRDSEPTERDWNQMPNCSVGISTKSASTSTEDITRTRTEDKSTSTDDLAGFDMKEESSGSPSNLSDTETDDNNCKVFHDINLTDATKVQFLQNQLITIQSQSVQERRKFSDTRRYWTDLTIADNLGVNELHRASSSPSLLGKSVQVTFQVTARNTLTHFLNYRTTLATPIVRGTLESKWKAFIGVGWLELACKTRLFFRLFPGERRQARSRREESAKRRRRDARRRKAQKRSSRSCMALFTCFALSFNRLKKREKITPVLQARYESPWRRGGGGGGDF